MALFLHSWPKSEPLLRSLTLLSSWPQLWKPHLGVQRIPGESGTEQRGYIPSLAPNPLFPAAQEAFPILSPLFILNKKDY